LVRNGNDESDVGMMLTEIVDVSRSDRAIVIDRDNTIGYLAMKFAGRDSKICHRCHD